MIWLSRPPWARWIGAGIIVVAALWIEVAPEPSVEHPFATVDIAPGEMIDSSNTEMRSVPAGLFEPVEIEAGAGGLIGAGDPILASDLEASDSAEPRGWWVISARVPKGARVGDPVQIVMLDTGDAVPGVVTAEISNDPFETGSGAIAVDPDHAASVATAAAEGRITVLVSTG